MNGMERTSEYYSTLSSDSKARYTEKVTRAGLKTDPYVIPNKAWTEEPVSVPKCHGVMKISCENKYRPVMPSRALTGDHFYTTYM